MYEDLSSLISRLHGMVDEESPQKGYWKQVWSLIKEISAGFKTTRFATKQEREEAWKRFQELVEEAKARGEADRVRIAEQETNWEKRKRESDHARSEILVKTHYTRPSTGIEQAIAAPILLPLQMVDAILRNILGLEDLDARKEELLSCSKTMRESWDLFNERKADLLPGDKAQLYKVLSDAQERLDAAWAAYKDESNRLFRLKQEAWERRKQERDEKHRLFVQRVTENISKLEGKLESATSALARHEARLEKLRDDLDNAWNDDFKERCSGWIEECEAKISDIQESVGRMTSWIDEERAKLR
ncbi:MAG TPA: hypothetical protein VN673_01600 [Clostridia bacterium]|nr:hypothetical protein [Clostridia bacterium]